MNWEDDSTGNAEEGLCDEFVRYFTDTFLFK